MIKLCLNIFDTFKFIFFCFYIIGDWFFGKKLFSTLIIIYNLSNQELICFTSIVYCFLSGIRSFERLIVTIRLVSFNFNKKTNVLLIIIIEKPEKCMTVIAIPKMMKCFNKMNYIKTKKKTIFTQKFKNSVVWNQTEILLDCMLNLKQIKLTIKFFLEN